MHALNRLWKLHLIADQNDIGGGAAHGCEIAERNLSCLIDEQIVVGSALIVSTEVKHRATDKTVLRDDIL